MKIIKEIKDVLAMENQLSNKILLQRLLDAMDKFNGHPFGIMFQCDSTEMSVESSQVNDLKDLLNLIIINNLDTQEMINEQEGLSKKSNNVMITKDIKGIITISDPELFIVTTLNTICQARFITMPLCSLTLLFDHNAEFSECIISPKDINKESEEEFAYYMNQILGALQELNAKRPPPSSSSTPLSTPIWNETKSNNPFSFDPQSVAMIKNSNNNSTANNQLNVLSDETRNNIADVPNRSISGFFSRLCCFKRT